MLSFDLLISGDSLLILTFNYKKAADDINGKLSIKTKNYFALNLSLIA